MTTLTFTIDGQTVSCPSGKTILQAADAAGVYIPRMCHHPDLSLVCDVVWAGEVHQDKRKITGERPSARAGEEAHCNLCVVQIEEPSEIVNSCVTPTADGLIITTDSSEVIRRRKQALSRILSDHPHACLTCAQKEGCSRTDCSSNVPVAERCCRLLGHCELQKVSEYVGIPDDTPKYVPAGHPRTTDDPLFERDFNLCIGCLRCVRTCQIVVGADVLAAVWKDGRAWVGTRSGVRLQEAQCRFCGACVEICPTGALLDKEDVPAVRPDTLVPCVAGCPAGMDIPRYVRSIADGRYEDALQIIRAAAPFPSLLGYVCFHPCENSCRRAEIDQAVGICALKRFVADTAAESESYSIRKQPDTDKKIAVIGSGPAGLSAAFYLSLQGNQVSLFDRESRPGGMLRYGIPDYRLPAEILDRELKSLDTLGVEFHMDYKLGDEHGIDELKSGGFDAILITTGTSANKSLTIENSDLDGIVSGLEFLRSAKLSQHARLEGRAVVIGGGNVGIDAAMTALRLEAEAVHLVCLESRDEMPAHEWEIAQAEEEGVIFHTSLGPRRYVAAGNRVSGIELVACSRVFDDQGRFAPILDETRTKTMPADFVIVAIGQQVDPELFSHVRGLSQKPGGTLHVDGYAVTGFEGVFAAGDVTLGPSSVVDAIADGKRAADTIDRFLGGDGLVESSPARTKPVTSYRETPYDIFERCRHAGRVADPSVRKSGFGLIQETLSEEDARMEAQRCLQCHLRQSITPVTLPPEMWQPLTAETVEAVPAAEGVFQLLDDAKKVTRIAGAVNLQQSLKECLENPGSAKWFIWEEDPMYTKRESELIQKYLQQFGELPGGGGGDDDLDDLF
jgi:NADPH-dependent glutamate synthase beta subunit-like oxidoreductase